MKRNVYTPCLFLFLFCTIFGHSACGARVLLPDDLISDTDESYSALVNRASKKLVDASSILQSDTGPELAIDESATSCYRSDSGDMNPYWEIDLGDIMIVKEVAITNRADCCGDELTGFAITGFTSKPVQVSQRILCAFVSAPIALGATETYTCDTPVDARWIEIEKGGSQLTLCEVKVFVEVTQSQIDSLNCTFEEDDIFADCNLFGTNTSDIPWQRGISSFGPSTDHTTGTTSGQYMYAELGGVTLDGKAILTTFEILGPKECLTFWYYVIGNGALSVRTLNETDLWKSDDLGISLWRRAQVEIGATQERIFFVVINSAGGFVAIDDLTVSSDECPFHTNIRDKIECDFDDLSGNICDFEQKADDDADWIWTNQETPAPGTGPSSPTSYYMYAKAHSAQGARMVLTSPVLRAPFPKSCVRFSYHYYREGTSGTAGVLQIKSTSHSSVPWSTTIYNDQIDSWWPASATLNTEPHSRVIFDVRSRDQDIDIAIDNITIINQECSGKETFSCDFADTICGYFIQSKTDDADWTTGDSGLKRPNNDFTGDDYLYPQFAGSPPGAVAELMSPIIETDASSSCLTFWYAMGTETELGTLQVISSDPDLANPRTVWSFSRGLHWSLTNHWAKAAITLNTSTLIRVTFRANNTDAPNAPSMDLVQLRKGPCPSEMRASYPFSCNFTDEELCGLGQMSIEDDFDWTRQKGSTFSDSTGPSAGISGVEDYYLYIESSLPRRGGERAVLYSPTFDPDLPKSSLSFYYHMRGSGIGTLSVYMDSSDSLSLDNAELLWTRTGEQGAEWIKASVEMSPSRPYKLFFEAVVGGTDMDGDIAIDQVEVDIVHGEILSTFSCSFDESTCGFMQFHKDDFDWVQKQIARKKRSAGTGPTTSPHVSGSFMDIVVDGSQSPGDTAILLSPLLHTLSTNYSCLVFWYHLHGASVGRLAVLTSDSLVENNYTLWSTENDIGDRWSRVAITIDTSYPTRVLFVGTAGEGSGDIAVDDVETNIGVCPHDRLVNQLRCDFDQPHVCGFVNRQNPDDDFDWLWQSGYTPDGAVTGPTGDHTTGSGHYMYMEASPPGSEGDKAQLISPYIKLDAPMNCLTFWYSMSGVNIATLRLHVVYETGMLSLWSVSGDRGAEWQKAIIPLDSPYEFQLVFEGHVGDGIAGDIAIDDFELVNVPCDTGMTEPESVNCTFSDRNLCGYTQSKMDDQDWTQSDGQFSSMSGGPSADNTTGDGLFMYDEEFRPKAVLVSPTLGWDVLENCLVFDYSMEGMTTGTLNVYLARAGMLMERKLMWTNSGESPAWMTSRIDFLLEYPVQIIFEAIRGPGVYSDTAIDNVKVLPHRCNEVTGVCDFTNDFCNLDPGPDPKDWVRTSSETPTPNTGPLADHTNGKDGHYIYVEPNNMDTSAAVLMVGEIEPDKMGISVACVSFWYMMYGNNPGTLSVFVTPAADADLSNQMELWTRTDQTDQQWQYAEVEVQVLYRIKIHFMVTSAGAITGNTALDDIGLRRQPCGSQPLPQSSADCNFDVDTCGYTQMDPGNVMHIPWTRTNGPTPTEFTGPTEDSPEGFPGYYMYMESNLPENNTGDTSELMSPPLTWSPQKTCLRFAYHMQGTYTGTLVVKTKEVTTGFQKVVWTATGDQGEGWKRAEVDVDLAASSTFHFISSHIQTDDERVVGNIGLDDVEITEGTCYPVIMTNESRFQCDRPTTPCVAGKGQCNSNTLLCDCDEGFLGLQCQFFAGQPCPSNPCPRGKCINQNFCTCPDHYYGNRCQHKMVYAECTLTKMVVNIFPYGFTNLLSWRARYPETADASCMLQPVDQIAAFRNRGWQGFAREFVHDNDPCGGSATVETETVSAITYSRQLYVFYDPLGLNPTDTNITVTCDVLKLPAPHVSVHVKELGRGRHPPSSSRVQTYIEMLFALRIPNRAHMTEIKVMECTASNGVHSVYIVKNGCAIHPVGTMVYDGKTMGTEYLIMQVFKRPQSPLSLHFRCILRLCDSRTDFFCYKRSLCFGRMKRSLSMEKEEMNGKLMNVEYTFTLTPE